MSSADTSKTNGLMAAFRHKTQDFVEGGAPMHFGAMNIGPKSGWALYQSGYSGGRAQAAVVEGIRGVVPSGSSSADSRRPGAVAASRFGARDPSSMKWMQKLAKDTTAMVDEVGKVPLLDKAAPPPPFSCKVERFPSQLRQPHPSSFHQAMGDLNEVGLMLAVSATETAILSDVIDSKLVGSPGLLLRSVASSSDPHLVAIYSFINRVVSDFDTRLNFLTELFPVRQREVVEPRGFYQVAVDLPPYNKVEQDRLKFSSADAMHRAVMQDVIRCLGKTNAFAVVAADKGAEMILGALREDPRVASFAVVRDPELEEQTASQVGDLFQPVLLLRDSSDPAGADQAAKLRESGVAAPEFNLEDRPGYFDNEAGRDMLLLFNAHQWKGALGLGLSKKLPQLTRVVGGISAWEGAVDQSALTPDSTPGSTQRQMQALLGGL